ncbi:hypothetical protein M758_9G097900 [Ceratodon purpureus]|nr:hypothetical protein M758_9G097900 [Ceratodon purpureus]
MILLLGSIVGGLCSVHLTPASLISLHWRREQYAYEYWLDAYPDAIYREDTDGISVQMALSCLI